MGGPYKRACLRFGLDWKIMIRRGTLGGTDPLFNTTVDLKGFLLFLRRLKPNFRVKAELVFIKIRHKC